MVKVFEDIKGNMKQFEGDLNAANIKIAFIVSRFNEFICNRLLEGAIDSFLRHEGKKENIHLSIERLAWVLECNRENKT